MMASLLVDIEGNFRAGRMKSPLAPLSKGGESKNEQGTAEYGVFGKRESVGVIRAGGSKPDADRLGKPGIKQKAVLLHDYQRCLGRR